MEVNETSEKELVEKFKQTIESNHPCWRVKTEVPIGPTSRADARVDEVDENGIVRAIVSYVEVKDASADVKELRSGYADALYYSEQSGSSGWLAVPDECIKKLMESGQKFDPRAQLFNLGTMEIVQVESITERMSKSRMKRKMESLLFQGWSENYTIETTSPLAITTPQYGENKEDVLFNLGPRIRGTLKETAKTISGTLSESIKYSLYVTPAIVVICKKSELTMLRKFVPNKTGGSAAREFYEIAPPRKFAFVVHCLNQRLTKEIVENLLRQAGQFAGLGDSHSDALHGRFNLVQN